LRYFLLVKTHFSLWSLIDFLCMDRGTTWRKSRRKFQEFLLYIKSKFVNFLSLSLFTFSSIFTIFLFCLFSILMTLMILDKFIFSPLSRNTQKCFLVSMISFITILWFFKREVVDIFDQTPLTTLPTLENTLNWCIFFIESNRLTIFLLFRADLNHV